jgi:hypothetical protein
VNEAMIDAIQNLRTAIDKLPNGDSPSARSQIGSIRWMRSILPNRAADSTNEPIGDAFTSNSPAARSIGQSAPGDLATANDIPAIAAQHARAEAAQNIPKAHSERISDPSTNSFNWLNQSIGSVLGNMRARSQATDVEHESENSNNAASAPFSALQWAGKQLSDDAGVNSTHTQQGEDSVTSLLQRIQEALKNAMLEGSREAWTRHFDIIQRTRDNGGSFVVEDVALSMRQEADKARKAAAERIRGLERAK